eukprot:6422551-Amphidinium_carterae.1
MLGPTRECNSQVHYNGLLLSKSRMNAKMVESGGFSDGILQKELHFKSLSAMQKPAEHLRVDAIL